MTYGKYNRFISLCPSRFITVPTPCIGEDMGRPLSCLTLLSRNRHKAPCVSVTISVSHIVRSLRRCSICRVRREYVKTFLSTYVYNGRVLNHHPRPLRDSKVVTLPLYFMSLTCGPSCYFVLTPFYYLHVYRRICLEFLSLFTPFSYIFAIFITLSYTCI